jgi:hypothetical protein
LDVVGILQVVSISSLEKMLLSPQQIISFLREPHFLREQASVNARKKKN